MSKRAKNRQTIFWTLLLLIFLCSAERLSVILADNPGSQLIINEFVATNGSGLVDEDGDYSDWIEIYNRGDHPVNLAGWALTNDAEQPTKWMFPDITLPGDSYLVIFASGKNRSAVNGATALHTNFRLGREGEFLGLYNVLETRFMDALDPQFPPQRRDMAYGRSGEELTFGYLTRPTPGGPNEEVLFRSEAIDPVQFSVPHGFFDAPFEVSLTTTTLDAIIYYTLDGSEPTRANGTPYTDPLTIDTTTVLRAAAFKPGTLTTPASAQTYLFLDDVLAQPADPPGFPQSWGTALLDAGGYSTVQPVTADYAMKPATGREAALKTGLQALPTFSLALSVDSLRALQSGNSSGDEQPISLELINPDDNLGGFQINAGLSPHREPAGLDSPFKQSFRLRFRSEYGATRLTYPIFPDSAVIEFDTLILQAVNGDPTYLQQAWQHASQQAMSGLGAHGTFGHLYLNGLYWGVYYLTERPDDAFMTTYVGDDEEAWAIIDQAGQYRTNLNRPSNPVDHLLLSLNLGQQTNGQALISNDLNAEYAQLATVLDPAQLSDALILNWYTSRQDWPALNGYMAVRRYDPFRSGRLILGPERLPINPDSPDFSAAGLLQPLLETLQQDPDFKIQLADRLYAHLHNDGVLSDAASQARWLALAETISPAMEAEAARWGDTGPGPEFTWADWAAARDETLAQLQGQAADFISQARQAGLYPAFDPPAFSRASGLVETGFSLAMTLPENCQNCTIYYTLNGSDPRLPVTGDLMMGATPYSEPLVLTQNSQVKARVLQQQPGSPPLWSALQEATFNVLEQDTKLRLTEVMYNPIGGDDYEFIELKNVGQSPVQLANLTVAEGIGFTFPSDAPPLAPGKAVVLVSNPAGFSERYPSVPIAGAYDGHLSNKGEKIELYSAQGELLFSVEYNDEYGWPVSADGRGDSINLVNPDGDPNDPRNWRASFNPNGSPGADEPGGSGS